MLPTNRVKKLGARNAESIACSSSSHFSSCSFPVCYAANYKTKLVLGLNGQKKNAKNNKMQMYL